MSSAARETAGPAEDPAIRRIRRGLALLLGGVAAAHLAVPAAFEAQIPEWVPGPASAWNLGSAVAEGVCAALLARRSTARAGGICAFVTFLVVWVANIQAAVAGGYPFLPAPWDSPAAAWLRVPLQLPLLWWAWRVAREPARGDRAGHQ